jgi:osmoprotectant transport system permease protein
MLARDIVDLTLEHLYLVGVSMGIAASLAIPVGILLTRRMFLQRWVLGFANVMQTVPSLALFGFLIPLPFLGGIGKHTAIVALVLYALLPILRNTLTGILAVDPTVRESAVAMGMTGRQLLWEVELPLATRTILAGLRIATVTTIGTATIAAAIGGGGLGVFIFRGLASVDTGRLDCGRSRSRAGMGRTEIVACLIVGLCVSAGIVGCTREHPITVGSKNFTEQVVLGEIVAQHLEHRLARPVARKFNLGGTMLAHHALVRGDIDLYPEYTGTALTAILKLPPVHDQAAGIALIRREYQARFGLQWMDPLGFNNTFAMVIRESDARKHNVVTLSDAARYAPGWTLGVGYEFQQRPDGLAGLLKTYQLPLHGTPKTMDLGLLYKALEQGQVSMVAGNATDGQLSVLNAVVLQDDQHYFPPYDCGFVVRPEIVKDYPALQQALDELVGRLSNQTMRKLNYQVDGEHRPVRDVAEQFLQEAGLLRR